MNKKREKQQFRQPRRHQISHKEHLGRELTMGSAIDELLIELDI